MVGGGQSGLAGARAARDAGLEPVVLEASNRVAGSWPQYYDSLTVFSPARYSGFPGAPFPGDPDRYPTRDEVVAYLESYAAGLGVDIRTGQRVESVQERGGGFEVRTASGETLTADGVVVASGSFANPYVPLLPGMQGFTGQAMHVAKYRDPKVLADRRVVVVGGGNSGVQVGYELAEVAQVTLAVRAPVQFVPQVRGGRDMHFWLTTLRLDLLPPQALRQLIRGTPVFDTGIYQDALSTGRLDQRELFTAFDGDSVVWSDGSREPVDVVLFATGYRPAVGYLAGIGALDANGAPQHRKGVSLTHPGLAYLGLEFQRSFSSNTLRGVHRDAGFVAKVLARQLRRRP